jgi:5-methylcytosine-specific restriction endonuclease McrA
MPYKDKEKQRAAQWQWMKRRRDAWFAEHGPCAKCKSFIDLELDHVDPKHKISHTVWSWADERRLAELSKCQALCKPCHKAKTLEAYQAITHCPKGHVYDSSNTKIHKGTHHCRTCERDGAKRRRSRI